MTSPPAITTRPVDDDDDELLFAIYASTREEELAGLPWSSAQKDGFLRMQHRAQQASYRQNYTGATYEILLLDGEAAGRLYVARSPSTVLVIDIALLPTHRGLGVGSAVLERLLHEARAAGQTLSLHVAPSNRARRLYERSGLRVVADDGVYLRMECPAGTD